MKTKFNYNIEDQNKLLTLVLQGLEKKIDTLSQFKQKNKNRPSHTYEYKILKYKGYIKREISILEKIKFDGYMLLLNDLVKKAREAEIFISCFGSIQNSLITYLLDLTQYYEFQKWDKFINFTPFEHTPTVNIVVSSPRIKELIYYLNKKYKHLIKHSTLSSVEFNDNLIFKFIDLGIDTKIQHYKEDVEDLGLEIVNPNLNISNKQAGIAKNNKLYLGLEALNIDDLLADEIIEERKKKYQKFSNYHNLKTRVKSVNNVDDKTKKILQESL